jgi:membrane glycosyltransferase
MPSTQLQSLENVTSTLAMPSQRLEVPFTDPTAPTQKSRRLTLGRVVLSIVPAALCALLAYLLIAPFGAGGLPGLGVWILCIAVIIPFYWDAVTAALALLGYFWKERPVKDGSTTLDIAILVLLFDEPADAVISRAVRLLSSLTGVQHSFSLYVLSDSRLPQSLQTERAIFDDLKRRHGHLDMTYVHREKNVDYKSGNIRAWVTSSGQAYDAMLVLDADSVMDRKSVADLANTLASDSDCALVQSIPRVLPGRTLWQSIQSCASFYQGVTLGRGLSVVSRNTANYYGHNALVRLKPFAAAAGLPHLSGEPPFGGVIMSHDFVEAALLCRAGWHVRFLPEANGSYEETPETFIGFLTRDRRWCHGNLQHMGLLRVPGFSFLSRFHLLMGAMSYLSAPFWLAALLLWTVVPAAVETSALLWPMLLISGVLLLPRILGLLATNQAMSRSEFYVLGRELFFSALIAPVLMVHRTRMILSILLGKASVWSKPTSEDHSPAFQLRFFGVEVLLGISLLLTWVFGFAAPLVLAAALPLLMAPVLSILVSRDCKQKHRSQDHENA